MSFEAVLYVSLPNSIPYSGSFIRPSPSISYGTTFLKALISKYVEIPHGTGIEKVILGSSGGTIEVEAVNLDKIRGKLSHVEKLREVSLDNEQVARSDPPGEINKTCPGEHHDFLNGPNIHDYSHALIRVVWTDIAFHLKHLLPLLDQISLELKLIA